MENCYPKFLYHPKCEPLIVNDRAQHEALGAGWVESPAEFVQAVEADEPEVIEEPKRRGRRSKSTEGTA
jgi:hypothetical protein